MHVMLVAADRDLRASLRSMLETRGHDVVACAGAREGLDRLDKDRALNAFIFADDANAARGAEICWEARLLSSFERPVYVCLVSPPLGSKAFIEALDCGADDVLQLPISADELYARLRAAERLNQMQHKLIEMATRDGLTGLYNRPAFYGRAAALLRDRRAPRAAIMADIDHFKAINDTYGHAAGDKAIAAVAAILAGAGDIVGRLGGEEFALLLDVCDAKAAWRAAENLRQTIAAREIPVGRAILRLSCSFGIAMSAGQKGAREEDIDGLLRKADAALYAAKRAGRDMVVMFDAKTCRARKFPRPPNAAPPVEAGVHG